MSSFILAQGLLRYWDQLAARYDPSRRQVLSLDIGVEKFSVILLERKPAGLKLLEQSIEFRNPKEGEKWWQAKLKQMIEEKRWKGKTISLTSSLIPSVIRRFQIPQVAPSELKSAVHWQMKDQLPFPIEQAVVEYRVISDSSSTQGSKQIDLLVAAAPEKEIKELVDSVEELGLQVRNAGLPATALENIGGQILSGKERVAVLEIGAGTTSFVILGKDGIHFHRQLQVTGKTITDALTGSIISESGRVDIHPEQAEALKQKYGIPERNVQGHDPQYAIELNKLGVMMRPALEKLANELQRTLDYYRAQFNRPDQKVEQILLSGGGGQLKGLVRFLHESLSIPVGMLDIPAVFKIGLPPERAARLNVVMSLALDDLHSFNLLPLTYRLKRSRQVQSGFLRVAAITAASLLLVFYLYQVWHLKQTQLQLETHQAAVKNMKAILDLKQEIEKRRHLVSSIRQNQLLCPNLMAELSRLVPDNLVLDELNFDNQRKEFSLKGILYSPPDESQKQLSDFIKGLRQSQYVAHLRLTTALQVQEQNQSGARFEIICSLSP